MQRPTMVTLVKSLGVLTFGAASFGAGLAAQSAAAPATFVSPGGTELRVLLDKQALGSADVEVGELTFPAGTDSGEHVHGSTEIFYVVSGELEHTVNSKTTVLKPGMVGFVKPPDMVRHKVGPSGPTKAVVIWVPGGEVARVVERWQSR